MRQHRLWLSCTREGPLCLMLPTSIWVWQMKRITIVMHMLTPITYHRDDVR